MNDVKRQVCGLAEGQHDVVASWQLRHFSVGEVREALRGLRRVHRGVCALGDLSEEGWYMAAALAMGPTGVVSHLSALTLMGLRPFKPHDVQVSYIGASGRAEREGLRPHRRAEIERWKYKNVPVTSPTQSLKDADLKPHELYRALEEAERSELEIHLLNDVVGLRQAITGRTRSDTEAAFILFCHDNQLPLPLVNQILNGYETDFHWPELNLVVEVDGFEHHKERKQFNNDRYRGLVHRAHGWEVIRVSADHVYDEPRLVLRALTAHWA